METNTPIILNILEKNMICWKKIVYLIAPLSPNGSMYIAEHVLRLQIMNIVNSFFIGLSRSLPGLFNQKFYQY